MKRKETLEQMIMRVYRNRRLAYGNTGSSRITYLTTRSDRMELESTDWNTCTLVWSELSDSQFHVINADGREIFIGWDNEKDSHELR